MEIAGYIKTSLIEWPGRISSVIFVPGCNFCCPFCHNADLVDDKVGRFSRIDEEQIFADLISRKGWVEVVVVTGGEPTLQADLSRFLSRLKQMGFLTMVHTNGTKPEVIERLIKKKLIDYWAMDLKGDLQNYSNYTNCFNDQIIKNVPKTIKLIINSGVEYEFRTTVVPGLHNLKNLIELARQLESIFVNCKLKIENCSWFLQQFRPINCLDKKYLSIKPYSEEELKKVCRKLQKIVPQTSIRGV